jgi:hypothetical protein
MGRWRITALAFTASLLGHASPAWAAEFRHFGYYLLQSHIKLTATSPRNIPIKPVVFHVSTDGISVRVSVDGEEESTSTFEIYRSDGIGHQRSPRGALEVIPGVQATNRAGGELRHLRLCKEFMTITTFPGVSDQTVISHAIAAEPKTAKTSPPAPIDARPATP